MVWWLVVRGKGFGLVRLVCRMFLLPSVELVCLVMCREVVVWRRWMEGVKGVVSGGPVWGVEERLFDGTITAEELGLHKKIASHGVHEWCLGCNGRAALCVDRPWCTAP